MDNLFISSFFFAVPNRLIWENWQKFNGEQTDPADLTDFTVPTISSTASTGYLNSSIHDYLGLPTEVPDLVHSALWHRAYNLIWNQWFRDENLQDSVIDNIDDGPDSATDYALLRRGKRHDYFTSALPFPQKHDSVDIPLGGNAPVTGIGATNQTFSPTDKTVYETGGTGSVIYTEQKQINDAASSTEFYVEEDLTNSGFPGIYADLSEATGATINALRQAFQIQKLYERDARGGTRYTEILKAHFGVTSPDARLQRPEYLGGGTAPISVSAIPQTSSTDGTSPQGNLAAFGTANINRHGFTKSFTEHCTIIGMVSVRADLNYQEGLDRMFSRSTRFDFFWPSLAMIGEQNILNKELYAQGSGDLVEDAATFGYQERFAEYRYKPSKITGQFRSNFATTLDTWHLAEFFDALPLLNASFIEDDPPVDRVIAINTEPHMLFDSYFQFKCARPMPVYGVPGNMDRF